MDKLLIAKFPEMLGAKLNNWKFSNRVINNDRKTSRMYVHYIRIQSILAQEMILTGRLTVDPDNPDTNVMRIEEQGRDLVRYCSHCHEWGHHYAYENGITTWAWPGWCDRCRMETTKDTYQLHEEKCDVRTYTCKPCKDSGFESAHKTQDLTACIWTRTTKAKAQDDRQAMQEKHNKELIIEINRRVRQVGGDATLLLKLAENAWQDIFSLERYLAYVKKLNIIPGKTSLSNNNFPPLLSQFLRKRPAGKPTQEATKRNTVTAPMADTGTTSLSYHKNNQQPLKPTINPLFFRYKMAAIIREPSSTQLFRDTINLTPMYPCC